MENFQELFHTLAVVTTTWATTVETDGFSSFLQWSDSSIPEQVIFILLSFSFLLTILRPLAGEHSSHLSMLAFTCLLSVAFLALFPSIALPVGGWTATVLIWVSALFHGLMAAPSYMDE